jgi:AcrR family transcriptional regulator
MVSLVVKLAIARELLATHPEMPAKRVAEVVGVSRATLYRHLPPSGRRIAT